MSRLRRVFQFITVAVVATLLSLPAFAKDKLPDPKSPPMLVNDFAHVLASDEIRNLEAKLVAFDNSSSVQITVVTVNTLGNMEVSDYAVKLFNKWGIGQKGKENGVLMLVAIDDRKGWITTGRGTEGVLTDARSGQIFRNEIVPAFKEKRYYDGLSDAADAIIAVTKGEYKNDEHKEGKGRGGSPLGTIIFIIIIIIIAAIKGGGRGGGGGRYMSGRGAGDIATGWIIGSLLGGGRSSGGGSWGGGGGGGFGGFGGGSSSGGGAGGGW